MVWWQHFEGETKYFFCYYSNYYYMLCHLPLKLFGNVQAILHMPVSF